MSDSSASADWLSPTRAWRLIECPASVRTAAVGGVSVVDHEQPINTGTLAHRALERWIRNGGYGEPNPGAVLAAAADSCAAEVPGGPPSGWNIVKYRLVARGPSLVDLIGERSPDDVLSEHVMHDHDLRLRGQLDLLLLGGEIVVVDLKTQTLIEDELPEWVQFQLNVYAHLVEKNYGSLPAHAEVFSLNRGRIEVSITQESLDGALDALAAARVSTPHMRTPAQTCASSAIAGWNVSPTGT